MTRLRFLGALVTTGALLVSVSGATASQAALVNTDWGSARNGAGRTAFNAYAGVSTSLGSYGVRWSVAGGTFSAPILVGSTVVVVDSNVGGRTRLEAFDSASGAARWKHDLGLASITSIGAPASDGTRVFAVIERSGGTNIWRYDLNAYSLTTGTLNWTAQLGTSSVRIGPKPILTTPGYLFVRGPSSNATRKVLKFSGSGQYHWSITASAPITNIALGGGVLYTASASSIHVADADSGVTLTSLGVGGNSIAVSGGLLYVASPTAFTAINTSFFNPAWSKLTAPGCGASVAVISAKVAYASQTCVGGAPIYVDRASGFPALTLQGIGPNDVPVAASGVIVLGVRLGALRAWNATSGASMNVPATAAKVSTGNGGGPIMAKGMVIVPEIGRLEVFG